MSVFGVGLMVRTHTNFFDDERRRHKMIVLTPPNYTNENPSLSSSSACTIIGVFDSHSLYVFASVGYGLNLIVANFEFYVGSYATYDCVERCAIFFEALGS